MIINYARIKVILCKKISHLIILVVPLSFKCILEIKTNIYKANIIFIPTKCCNAYCLLLVRKKSYNSIVMYTYSTKCIIN